MALPSPFRGKPWTVIQANEKSRFCLDFSFMAPRVGFLGYAQRPAASLARPWLKSGLGSLSSPGEPGGFSPSPTTKKNSRQKTTAFLGSEGGVRTHDPLVTLIHYFRKGVDYIIYRLESVIGSEALPARLHERYSFPPSLKLWRVNRIVSEPFLIYRTWLRIALAIKL
jgi:hypothetical protein